MQRVIRRRYTDDFKAQAVSLAQSIGPSNAARQLDISVKTLANWLDKPARASDSTTAKRTPTSEADSELSRLRAENAMLKMERDILKKRRRSLPISPHEVRLRRGAAGSLSRSCLV